MYYIQKKLEISASHRLTVNYESKCTRVHGHNWVITLYCKARELDENGMVVDFTQVKPPAPERCAALQPHGREYCPLVHGADSTVLQMHRAGERG